MEAPHIAILGGGIFVRTEYIPRLAQISHLFTLKVIWSRTEESARGTVEIAKEFFPGVECKWGDSGVDDIIQDPSINAVLVVLAAQFQLEFAGGFVIEAAEGWKACSSRNQQLLVSSLIRIEFSEVDVSVTELETALSHYNSLINMLPFRPIWAVAENYRFEPAFVEGKKLMAEIGDLVNFQIIAEAPMNNSNPYFSSSWRHSFTGGYILDMGVHYVAALRMIAGCEVTAVSAMTSHVDTTLPPPDSMSSMIQLENGRSGVLVTVVSAKTFKMMSRFVGSNGTLQFDIENREGKYGFLLTLFMANGESKSSFYPLSGVTEELKTFFHDVSQVILKKDDAEAERRLSYAEGGRDLTVLDAMLESGNRQGALIQVNKT